MSIIETQAKQQDSLLSMPSSALSSECLLKLANVSCEHFMSSHSNLKIHAKKLMDGDIPFRKMYINAKSATAPNAVLPGLSAAWLFEYHSLSWNNILRQMFLQTKKEIYKEKFIEYVVEWLDTYGIPSEPLPTAKEPGNFSWYDMSVAFRVDILLGLLSILDPRQDLFAHIKMHISIHKKVLLNDFFYAKQGNHALHQNNALLSAGLLLLDRESIQIAINRIITLLTLSIDEEGVCKEGSVAYQAFNSFWWIQSIKRLKLAQQWFGNTVPEIPDMRVFLAHCIAPDGQYVPIGDSFVLNTPLIDDYHNRFGGAYLDYLCQDPYLAFALTNGTNGIRPQTSLTVFKEGYCFSRNNNGDTPSQDSHCSVRFGAGLATRVHAHDDGGSITYYPNGTRLIEDGGMYGYYGGYKRDFVKSCFAHNSMMSFSKKYYRSAINELQEYHTTEEVDFFYLNIKSLEKTKWARKVLHHKKFNFLFVEDIYQSDDASLFQNWNLHSQFSLVNVLPNRVDVECSRIRASFFWLCENVALEIRTGSQSPMLGWASKTEGDFHKTLSIQASVKANIGKLPVVIVPYGHEIDFENVAIESVKLKTNKTIFSFRCNDDAATLSIPPCLAECGSIGSLQIKTD